MGVEHSQSREALSYVQRICENPWASGEDDQLYAIEFLSQLGTKEVLPLLTQLLELARGSSKKQNTALEPRCGRVPARAAMALGRLADAGGPELLSSYIINRGQHPSLREAAVFGLRGLLHPAAFAGFASGLLDPDPGVRRFSVQGFKGSLERAGNSKNADLLEVCGALARMVLNSGRVGRGLEDDGAKLARHMLHDYWCKAAEQACIQVMLETDHPQEACLAIDLLGMHRSENVHLALSNCLLDKERSAAVYRSIGLLCKSTSERFLCCAAQTILEENEYIRKFTCMLFPSRREALCERHAAAQLILG